MAVIIKVQNDEYEVAESSELAAVESRVAALEAAPGGGPHTHTEYSASDHTHTTGPPVGGTTPPPPNQVDLDIYPGENWQAAVDAHPDGSVFSIKAGPHVGQQVVPKQGQQFIGEPGAIMDGNGASKAFDGSAADVRVFNLEIINYAPGPQHAAVHLGGDNVIVSGCHIHHNANVGVQTGWGSQQLNNIITDNGQMGSKVTGSNSRLALNALIEGNEVARNGHVVGSDGGVGERGGSKYVRTDGLVIRNNDFHHNAHAAGIWLDINNYRSIIEGNTVDDNDNIGIALEIGYDAIVRNNTCRRNGRENWPSGSLWMFGAGILLMNNEGIAAPIHIHDNVIEMQFGNGEQTTTGIGFIDQNRQEFGGGLEGYPFILRNVVAENNTFSGDGSPGNDYRIFGDAGRSVADMLIFIDGVQAT